MQETEELKIAKHNRRNRKEAEKGALIYHPPLPYIDRKPNRRQKDKKVNLIVKKARKKIR
ncbi:hypothetical protein HY404_01565 [Candidatus Microgenomates bacterium]|nr:hypothetical protein [Candidatus Microgenomates bacterium]